MVEKDLELELDIQYIKNVINNCTCVYNNTKLKFADFRKKYNTRKEFIIAQFKNIFFNNLRC